MFCQGSVGWGTDLETWLFLKITVTQFSLFWFLCSYPHFQKYPELPVSKFWVFSPEHSAAWFGLAVSLTVAASLALPGQLPPVHLLPPSKALWLFFSLGLALVDYVFTTTVTFPLLLQLRSWAGLVVYAQTAAFTRIPCLLSCCIFLQHVEALEVTGSSWGMFFFLSCRLERYYRKYLFLNYINLHLFVLNFMLSVFFSILLLCGIKMPL